MSRQLATMISSGLSLLRALTILAEQTENPALARVVAEVRGDIEGGRSLSAALGRHPKVFPAAHDQHGASGRGRRIPRLGPGLGCGELRVRGEAARQDQVRDDLPVVVFCIAILAVIGMLLFIVPTFQKMFETLGGELPFLTQILVAMSNGLKVGIFPLIALIILGVYLWNANKRKKGFRQRVEPLYLKAPVFGGLGAEGRACPDLHETLGAMLRAGVPILQSLDIVGEASGNIVIENATHDVRESVRTGNSLAKPLAQHPIFPPMAVQMMAVGEDTGALDQMLDKIADFYDQEVESTTEALTSLIEPLMIAVLGAIIGFMVIGLYMPIFSVFDLVK